MELGMNYIIDNVDYTVENSIITIKKDECIYDDHQ